MTKNNSVSFNSYVSSYINELKLDSIIRKNNNSESTSLRTGEKDLKSEGSTDNFLDEICGSEKCIIVLNKTDLLHDVTGMKNILKHYNGIIALSCKTEDGIPQLLDKMTSNLTML
jgi:tRNA U34 5-carboxymethylaminomethyl modifying GTPase MnmE/TrmE